MKISNHTANQSVLYCGHAMLHPVGRHLLQIIYPQLKPISPSVHCNVPCVSWGSYLRGCYIISALVAPVLLSVNILCNLTPLIHLPIVREQFESLLYNKCTGCICFPSQVFIRSCPAILLQLNTNQAICQLFAAHLWDDNHQCFINVAIL